MSRRFIDTFSSFPIAVCSFLRSLASKSKRAGRGGQQYSRSRRSVDPRRNSPRHPASSSAREERGERRGEREKGGTRVRTAPTKSRDGDIYIYIYAARRIALHRVRSRDVKAGSSNCPWAFCNERVHEIQPVCQTRYVRRAYTHIYTWRREPLIFQAFSRAAVFQGLRFSNAGSPRLADASFNPEKRVSPTMSGLASAVCVCVCVLRRPAFALLRQEFAVSLAVLLSFSPSFSPPPVFLLNYADVSRVSIAFRSRYSPAVGNT